VYVPSTKRKRSDEPDAEPLPNPRRSEIWYEDGNIVLQAGMTQFRVYRGILRDKSPIFKDMFDVPQPSDNFGSFFEGCPVMRVMDSAEDWEHVLNALYKRR
jgi:hypothetical protein